LICWLFFSRWRDRHELQPELLRTPVEVGDDALSIALLVAVGLPAISVFLAAGQHRVDQPRELDNKNVSRRCVRSMSRCSARCKVRPRGENEQIMRKTRVSEPEPLLMCCTVSGVANNASAPSSNRAPSKHRRAARWQPTALALNVMMNPQLEMHHA
jgi:hypothetical protein